MCAASNGQFSIPWHRAISAPQPATREPTDLIAMVASNLAATAQMLAFQCEMKMNPEFSVDVENRLNLYRSMQAQDEYLRLSEARKRVIQDEILPPNGPPLLKGNRFSLGAHSPLRGGALYSDPGALPLSFGGRPPRPEKARKPYQPWSNGSKKNVAAGGIAGPSMLSKGSIPIQVDAPGRATALPRKTQINKPTVVKRATLKMCNFSSSSSY